MSILVLAQESVHKTLAMGTPVHTRTRGHTHTTLIDSTLINWSLLGDGKSTNPNTLAIPRIASVVTICEGKVEVKHMGGGGLGI